jgi:hypothetical protein
MKILPAAVANKVARPLLHLQKASPQIMFGGGIVAGAAGVVLACRSTLKLSGVLEEFEELKLKAEVLHGNPDLLPEGEHYDEKAYAKDLTVIKVKTILAVTKLYAPAAGLLLISASLLTGSHVTLNKRNTGLAAAYAATDQAFNQYRERVRDQLGKDVDDEMRYGTRIVEEKVQTDDGKTKTVKKKQVGDGVPSQYARFFDKLCKNWQPEAEYNLAFLRAQQQYANDMLLARGHLLLNDVYDALGLERSYAGSVVGWVHGNGDSYVDFGIYDGNNEKARDFVNGIEHSILLDFNVDGAVNHLIGRGL